MNAFRIRADDAALGNVRRDREKQQRIARVLRIQSEAQSVIATYAARHHGDDQGVFLRALTEASAIAQVRGGHNRTEVDGFLCALSGRIHRQADVRETARDKAERELARVRG